jgi:putative membrane protein insertion efficiency factor
MMVRSLSAVCAVGERALVGALVFGCRFWQVLLSPLAGQRCRFHPTCSAYAVLSLREHGLFRGSRLAIYRICRCHPFARGGVDPVPPRRSAAAGSGFGARATGGPGPFEEEIRS